MKPISGTCATKPCRKSATAAAASNGGRSTEAGVHRLLDGRLPRLQLRLPLSGTRPGLVALSAVYSVKDFFGGDRAGDIYFNSPLDYLPGLDDAAAA